MKEPRAAPQQNPGKGTAKHLYCYTTLFVQYDKVFTVTCHSPEAESFCVWW